ncbi:xylosyltransferase oxt-like [Tubulanus polymorphus]|uniref:xylosyltransferase oxt-like n=1 Tax=Tubulanus polymorphus TaxID=672921 RepID=UPI003DA2F905
METSLSFVFIVAIVMCWSALMTGGQATDESFSFRLLRPDEDPGVKFSSGPVRFWMDCAITCGDDWNCDGYRFVSGTCELYKDSSRKLQTPTPASEQIIIYGKVYRGCYRDSQTRRDFPVTTGRQTPQHPDLCRKSCGQKGYYYAALQNTDECYCGKFYGNQGRVPDSECNQGCLGNEHVMCGGPWRNSVYTV